jgi:hypothetical protein
LILACIIKMHKISMDYPIGTNLAFIDLKIVFGVFRGIEILVRKRLLNRRFVFPAPLKSKPHTRGGSSYRIDGGG